LKPRQERAVFSHFFTTSASTEADLTSAGESKRMLDSDSADEPADESSA
jgi:hypothetical protein